MVKTIFLIGSVLLVFCATPPQGSPEENSDPLYIAQVMRMPKIFTITIHGGFDGNTAVTWLDPRELRAGRGETVIWINESQADIRIKIGENQPARKSQKITGLEACTQSVL